MMMSTKTLSHRSPFVICFNNNGPLRSNGDIPPDGMNISQSSMPAQSQPDSFLPHRNLESIENNPTIRMLSYCSKTSGRFINSPAFHHSM